MDQINYMAMVTLLLLGVIVFAVGKDETGIRREGALSCGRVQSAKGQSSWPGENNSGNGCTHQPGTAALLGRSKRAGIHGC